MTENKSLKWFALIQRELQEYRVSIVWTPIVIAAVLALIMLGSILLANRISALGEAIVEVISHEEITNGMKISIHVEGDEVEILKEQELSGAPTTASVPETHRVQADTSPVEEDDWNFSKDWTFEPKKRDTKKPSVSAAAQDSSDSFNPLLNMLHSLMLMVLVFVSANYLLGCLYNDRKDRSILFFKSMPVSERQEVLVRFSVAVFVAPVIFIGVSLLVQLIGVLMAMLLVWRMEMDPFTTVLANIQFGSLLLNQVGGWLLTALWIAPVYAWLMLASAWAKRSPFMMAVAPVIGAILLERIFVGSDYVSTAITHHVPHFTAGAEGASAVGYYIEGIDLLGQDYIGLVLGLVFTALALAAAVYLRRYRFEI